MTDEEWNVQLENDLSAQRVKIGLLKANLTALMIKEKVDYNTSVNEYQQLLRSKYHVEHTLDQIKSELLLMEEEDNQVDFLGGTIEIPEDFYDGY